MCRLQLAVQEAQMMGDPMLQRLLVVCGYPLVVLLSLVQAAAAEVPVRSTHQGQVGVYRLQLTEALVPLAGQRFELTLTSRVPGDQVQLSSAMLAPALPATGAGANSLPPMPLSPRRVSSGVYLMLVRRHLPGWWFLRLVVQGNRGTARGAISLRVESPTPPPWLVWRVGLLTLALLVYAVWEHHRHKTLNGRTCVQEGGMADSLW
jgi:hypothetical protein